MESVYFTQLHCLQKYPCVYPREPVFLPGIIVFCVCFVSSLGFFFLYLSRDKNTRESERCVCGKKKVRARSVFPSSDDDERFGNAEIVPKASSERSWRIFVHLTSTTLSSKVSFFVSFLYRLQQKYVREI